MSLEIWALNAIQSHLGCRFLDITMPVITKLGNGGAIWIVCALMLIFFPKTRRIGTSVLVSLAIEALCCNVILKPLIARVRPYDVNTAVQLLITPPTDYSFPSGHTGASFAAASALYFSRNKLWYIALVLAVLIAFSRLYLYVHYPSDVFSGALIGLLAGWIGYKLMGISQTAMKKFKDQKG